MPGESGAEEPPTGGSRVSTSPPAPHISTADADIFLADMDVDDEGIVDRDGSSYLTDSSDSSNNFRSQGPPTAEFRGPINSSSHADKKDSATFHDMVHSHIKLPNLCYLIINTPQFQRLRNLKQLGVCYYVYPSACHNRFEHCIGTAYLAGEYGTILQTAQPELEIDDRDIKCLHVAGLCHDLGHGPFSHTWEGFMHHYNRDYSHEVMSVRMIDHLFKDNGLMDIWKKENLTDRDLVFVKELILGRPLSPDGDVSKKETDFQGRPPRKHFLYEIVSNSKTKIDVDKFDYLLRDARQLNVTTAFDYKRVLENSRVFYLQPGSHEKRKAQVMPASCCNEDTPTTIAYRKKISVSLEELFGGRSGLHKKAYQHKATKVIEEMILDGLHAAEPYFQVTSEINPKSSPFSLSTAHKDISAFMKLTDSVLEHITNWNNGGKKAKRIFGDILNRRLYRRLGYLKEPVDDDLLKELEKLKPAIALIRIKIDYGAGSENPLNNAWFYEKSDPTAIYKETFEPPKTEKKCYIHLRPPYAYLPDNSPSHSTDEEEEIMKGTEIKVMTILNAHEAHLETE